MYIIFMNVVVINILKFKKSSKGIENEIKEAIEE